MIHARPDGSFTLYVPYCVNSTYSCVQPVLQLYVIHEISQNNTVSIRTKHSRLSRSSFPRNILANIGRCGACGRVRERAESGIAAIGETHARIVAVTAFLPGCRPKCTLQPSSTPASYSSSEPSQAVQTLEGDTLHVLDLRFLGRWGRNTGRCSATPPHTSD